MSFREKIGARKIYLAASNERDGVINAGAALDVARRDRLATADAHADTAAGGVKRI
jgi:hypothetical protein